MKKFIYLIYNINKTPFPNFIQFLSFANRHSSKSRFFIIIDCFKAAYKQNISLLDYFYFKFYEKDKTERDEWAGTGFMYEYQLLMNPMSARDILDDKRLFYKKYQQYFLHQVVDLETLRFDSEKSRQFFQSSIRKIVLKVSNGKCGQGVEVRDISHFTESSLIKYMEINGFDLVEEFIVQHSDLQNLSSSAVNTVRIFTQLNNNSVEILGCRLRISVNSHVDNMAAGNLAAPIDENTGLVSGPGVYSDITKPDEKVHPISGVSIIGFKIPFWNETLDMVKKAAVKYPQNKSVGWDIVITEKGPGLIEGNHDWCKLLWQLPVKKGLKKKLEKYS